MKNCRKLAGANQRPSSPASVANSPMTNEPDTFTTSAPQGKVSPKRLAIRPDPPHRARLPRPPPMNIHNAFHINPTLPLVAALAGVISAEFSGGLLPQRGRRQTPLPPTGCQK